MWAGLVSSKGSEGQFIPSLSPSNPAILVILGCKHVTPISACHHIAFLFPLLFLWGHSFLLLCAVRDKLLQSCLTLCQAMDCSPPGSCVRGILQARILEWVAISFSRTTLFQPSLVSSLAWEIFSFFLAALHGLWNLSFPIRIWTQTLAVKASGPNHWTTREFPRAQSQALPAEKTRCLSELGAPDAPLLNKRFPCLRSQRPGQKRMRTAQPHPTVQGTRISPPGPSEGRRSGGQFCYEGTE